jgi:hypothetical protein
MYTVWKLPLHPTSIQELEVPVEHQVLSAKVINNQGFLWVKVNLESSDNKTKLKILTIPTGTEFSQSVEYIDTLIYNNGEIIQHIFKIL